MQAKKQGRPSKTELKRRQTDKERVDAANLCYLREFEARLLVRMQESNAVGVNSAAAIQFMQTFTNDIWIFRDRESVEHLLLDLVRHRAWYRKGNIFSPTAIIPPDDWPVGCIHERLLAITATN